MPPSFQTTGIFLGWALSRFKGLFHGLDFTWEDLRNSFGTVIVVIAAATWVLPSTWVTSAISVFVGVAVAFVIGALNLVFIRTLQREREREREKGVSVDLRQFWAQNARETHY